MAKCATKAPHGDVTSAETSLRKRLLDARTQLLAHRKAGEAERLGERCLICDVGNALYAIALSEVARTTPLTRLGAVPASRDPALIGLAADQGRILQVFDLAARLGASPTSETAKGYIIILRQGRVAVRTLNRPQAALAVPTEEADHLRLDAPGGALDGRTATRLSLNTLFSPSPAAQLESAQP